MQIICNAVATCGLLVMASVAVRAQTLYQTNFDSLTAGHTQTTLGAAGQDGWYRQITDGTNYGEIESGIANSGNALHEFSPSANPTGDQSQDARNLTQIALSNVDTMTLSFDFQARSSDLSTVDSYTGNINVTGVEGGDSVLGVGIFGGNGTSKTTTGVNVTLGAYNGINNNFSATLTTGQHLTWNAWHSVSLVGDIATDTYVSLTVDGVTQSLSGLALPDYFVGGTGFRPLTIRDIETDIIANNSTFTGNRSNDDIYWDNLKISYTAASAAAPEPAALALLLPVGLPALLSVARRCRRRMASRTCMDWPLGC